MNRSATGLVAIIGVWLWISPWWAVTASAEIYKWTDARGNVHYSDARPEQQQAETLTPDTARQGVELSKPQAAQQWKQDALQNQTAPLAPTSPVRQTGTPDPSTQNLCEGKVGDCFTRDQDHVCKLRYGTDCQSIHHWKVCLHQNCTDNRLVDKCDSPFYYLDRRPVMLGRRDLGRPLPLQEWVSAQDWQCLSSHGFFCDEVAFEQQCQQQYNLSCQELKTWVAAAQARCRDSRDGDCRDIDVLIRYRPAPLEEMKKVGNMNASGTVVVQDLLMQSLGVYRHDPADYPRLQPVLDAMTGLNIGHSRRGFDCQREWPTDLR